MVANGPCWVLHVRLGTFVTKSDIMSLFTPVSARARLRFFWAEPKLSQQCEHGSARILLKSLRWTFIQAVGGSHLWLGSGSARLGFESEPSSSWAQCKKAQCLGCPTRTKYWSRTLYFSPDMTISLNISSKRNWNFWGKKISYLDQWSILVKSSNLNSDALFWWDT